MAFSNCCQRLCVALLSCFLGYGPMSRVLSSASFHVVNLETRNCHGKSLRPLSGNCRQRTVPFAHSSSDNSKEDIDASSPLDEQQRSPLQSPVETFTSLSACLQAMDNDESVAHNNDKKLTVILFFAHYCKMCHQANIPYKRLAYQQEEVRFTRMETSSMTRQQMQSLGISRVPFVQIYRQGMCVASFSTGWKLGSILAETLTSIQSRNNWHDFGQQFKSEIQENQLARSRIKLGQLVGESNSSNDRAVVTTLASEAQFLDALQHNKDPSFVVVLFHCHDEHASHRAQYQFRRLAEQYHSTQQRQQNPFLFQRIDSSVLSDSSLEMLGIDSFPHIQVYRCNNDENPCVASFAIPQTYLFYGMAHGKLQELAKQTDWTCFDQQHAALIQKTNEALSYISQFQQQIERSS